MRRLIREIIIANIAVCLFACGSSNNQDTSQSETSGSPDTTPDISIFDTDQNNYGAESAYSITRDVIGLTKYFFKTDASEHAVEDIELDSLGRLSSASCWKVPAKYSFEYNNNNQMVKCIADHNGSGVETGEVKYNEDGTVNEILFEKIEGNSVKKSKDMIFSYDENGLLKSIANGSEITLVKYDDQNRMISRELFDGGKIIATYNYSYSDSYNPNGRQEITYDSGKTYSYSMDIQYDERGNRVLENVQDYKGDRYQVKFLYGKVGTITESPDTNPNLQSKDKWVYFEQNSEVPTPESCITNIAKLDGLVYQMPSTKGVFFLFHLGYELWFEPAIVDGERAFVALDQYLKILEDVCHFEIKKSSKSYDVLKNGSKVANIRMYLNNPEGYLLEVSFD